MIPTGSLRFHISAKVLPSGISAALAATTAIQAINVLTGVLLARGLGPSNRGILAAVVLWPALIATVLSAGLQDSLVYHFARYPLQTKAIYAAGLLIAAASALLVCFPGFLILWFVLIHYGRETILDAWTYAVATILAQFTAVAIAVLQSSPKSARFNCARSIVYVTSGIGLLGLALAHRLSVRGAVIVYLAANLITLLGAYWLAGMTWPSYRPDASTVRRLLGYGLRAHGGTVSGIANERGDQAVISVFLTSSQLGIYAAATTTTSMILLLGSTLGLLALPRVAGAASEDDRRSRALMFLGLTLVVSVLTGAVLMAVMPQLILFAFGVPYISGLLTARVLVVGAVVLAVHRMASAILKAYGRPLASTGAEVGSLCVTVALLIALVPRLGILGAAMASVAAYTVALALSGFFLTRGSELARSVRVRDRPER